MPTVSKEAALMVQVTPSLAGRLEALAKTERRTVENQALYLIENALRVFEGGGRGTGDGIHQ